MAFESSNAETENVGGGEVEHIIKDQIIATLLRALRNLTKIIDRGWGVPPNLKRACHIAQPL